ncbi:MAG: hypothetical protein M3Q65_26050 [Chloroflexota bacterium]|nr:hypothetical protein [Chloroflexota bacterium]
MVADPHLLEKEPRQSVALFLVSVRPGRLDVGGEGGQRLDQRPGGVVVVEGFQLTPQAVALGLRWLLRPSSQLSWCSRDERATEQARMSEVATTP